MYHHGPVHLYDVRPYTPDPFKVGIPGAEIIDRDPEAMAPTSTHEFGQRVLVLDRVLHDFEHYSVAGEPRLVHEVRQGVRRGA